MKNKKNIILMILHKNFPDLRVCQEIDALTENGYEVYVIAPNILEESFGYSSENYNLIDIDFKQNKFSLLISLSNNNYKAILNRIIKNKLFMNIKDRIFAVHVHDLTMSKVGYSISKMYSYKFVVDYHENWPAMKEFSGDNCDEKYSFKHYVYNRLTNYDRIVDFEKRTSVLADKIIVVVDENKIRLVKNYLLNPDKVHIVSNTKDPDDYVNYGLNMKDESINLFYHGTIQRLRGIRTLVEAFKRTENDKVKLTLTIIGFQKGCKEKKYIIDLYDGVLPANLELIDWTTDREFVLSKIIDADLCVIPHDKSDLADTTVPNKIFEYMCYGKAILVSDVKPLERILSTTESGLMFKASDVENLKSVLESLGSKEELTVFSRNARQSVEGDFNWNNDINELVQMYGELL